MNAPRQLDLWIQTVKQNEIRLGQIHRSSPSNELKRKRNLWKTCARLSAHWCIDTRVILVMRRGAPCWLWPQVSHTHKNLQFLHFRNSIRSSLVNEASITLLLKLHTAAQAMAIVITLYTALQSKAYNTLSLKKERRCLTIFFCENLSSSCANDGNVVCQILKETHTAISVSWTRCGMYVREASVWTRP